VFHYNVIPRSAGLDNPNLFLQIIRDQIWMRTEAALSIKSYTAAVNVHPQGTGFRDIPPLCGVESITERVISQNSYLLETKKSEILEHRPHNPITANNPAHTSSSALSSSCFIPSHPKPQRPSAPPICFRPRLQSMNVFPTHCRPRLRLMSVYPIHYHLGRLFCRR
jgi:hypothetical protein